MSVVKACLIEHGAKVGLGLATLCVTSTIGTFARADEVHLLSAGAVEPSMKVLAAQFEKSTGHSVKLDFSSAPQITQKLATPQRVDILIAPEPGLTAELKGARFDSTSLSWIGKVGMSVVVREGANRPAVQSVEQVENALKQADRVIYNIASTGLHLQKQFDGLGWSTWIAPKSVRPNRGADVAERIKVGQGDEIGFGASTEMAEHKGKGLVDLGPAPGALQNFTRYGLVLPRDASPAAKQFFALITSSDARKLFVEMGAWVD